MVRTSKLRYGAVATVGAVAMMLGTSCAAIGGTPEREVVVVGVDLELSGRGEALGNVFRNALELRVEQVNQQGLLGDRQLELRVLDNRSEPATGVDNLRELAEDPAVVAIITGACDECVIGAADILNEQGVPTISLGRADEVAQPVEERRYVFKLGPNANHNAAALVRELERSEVETIGLVTTGDGYGDDGAREMSQAAARAGLEIVVTAQLSPDDEAGVADAADAIVAYQPDPDPNLGFVPDPADGAESGPDAVVVWAPGAVAGELAVTLRELDYAGPLFLDSTAADELFLTGAIGTALNGARLVFSETLVIDEVIATSPAKAARKAWFNDYTAQIGTYHAHSSFAADAVEVIVEAINQVDGTDRDAVRDAVEGTLLEGFSGPIRLRLENHSGLSPQTITTLVAQGDRWRLATA